MGAEAIDPIVVPWEDNWTKEHELKTSNVLSLSFKTETLYVLFYEQIPHLIKQSSRDSSRCMEHIVVTDADVNRKTYVYLFFITDFMLR